MSNLLQDENRLISVASLYVLVYHGNSWPRCVLHSLLVLRLVPDDLVYVYQIDGKVFINTTPLTFRQKFIDKKLSCSISECF